MIRKIGNCIAATTMALTTAVAEGQPAAAAHDTAPPAKETRLALSARQAAIPPIGAWLAIGDVPRLKEALVRGLEAGLTVAEIKEILVQLYAYAGFPRSLNGLAAFMEVLKDRQAHGRQDVAGAEPGPLPAPDLMREAGTANQTKLVGRPATSPIYDFAPAVDDYLKTHLFGAIFARDNLDWQSRELATLGALASPPGLESQLQSHMGISLNVGLTHEQLEETAAVLASQVAPDVGTRARSALSRAAANR